MTATQSFNDKYLILIIIVSVAIPLIIALLIFNQNQVSNNVGWISFLPHINGIINTLTSIILVIGWLFIKNKKVAFHKTSMLTAFVLGAFFLISYVIYHSYSESTAYGGEGMIRYIYYFLLITHIMLAIAVVPFVLLAIYYGISARYSKHKRIVKYTLPIWLYVSITGVIVYLMISPYY